MCLLSVCRLSTLSNGLMCHYQWEPVQLSRPLTTLVCSLRCLYCIELLLFSHERYIEALFSLFVLPTKVVFSRWSFFKRLRDIEFLYSIKLELFAEILEV